MGGTRRHLQGSAHSRCLLCGIPSVIPSLKPKPCCRCCETGAVPALCETCFSPPRGMGWLCHVPGVYGIFPVC